MAVPISKDLLYTEILGIPRHECPPSHYRLLGLNNFERDPAIIQQAINSRVGLVQQAQRGTMGDEMIRHLREVGNLLLTPHLKESYDGILLQQTMNPSAAAPAAAADDYRLRPSPPVPPAPSPPPPAGNYAPPAVARTGPAMPATTATARPRKKHPGLKRSRVYVPIWARVLITAMFVAAHGAIYWYAYDYMNRPSTTPTTTLEREAQANNTGVPKRPEKNEVVATTPQPTAPSLNTPSSPQPTTPPKTQNSSATSVASTTPLPATSDPFGSIATPSGPSLADQIEKVVPTPSKPKPFSQLEPFVGLPELKPEFSTREGATTIGSLVADVAAEMELAIESAAVDLSGQRFDVTSNSTTGSATRNWDVNVVTNGADQPEQSKPVGHLHTDESGTLKFHWNANTLPAEAEQLQNTMLVCAFESHQHAMALRVPETLPAIAMNLDGKSLISTVSLTAPPLEETLHVAVNFKQSIPVTTVAQPVDQTTPVGDNVILTLGDSDDVVQGEIRVVTKRNSNGELEVAVLPKYRQTDDGRLSELTDDKLVSQLNRLQRLLSDDARDLASAYASLPNHLANMKKLQATTPRNNDEYGAKSRALIQMQGFINKCQSTIRAKTRTMPGSYQAMHKIIEAARLGRKLDGDSSIQFRVFAKTPSGEIVIARGVTAAATEADSNTFAFLDKTPGVAGTWVRLKPELQVLELTSGGSISARTASGGIRSGSWSKSGDKVRISFSDMSGDFTFYNGVALGSDAGHEIYRKF